ncbi:MAG: hypothetical protein WD768_21700 [Phycisphaeraceae bacterium]
MTNQKRTRSNPAKPPVSKPEPVGGDECDPLPTNGSKGGSNKPACPEGYPDRQPTAPPAEDPEQQPH